MPKATLVFNLPEEQEEYQTAVGGANAASTLHKINNYLRNIRKYSNFANKDWIYSRGPKKGSIKRKYRALVLARQTYFESLDTALCLILEDGKLP